MADAAGVSDPYNRGTLLGTIAREVSAPLRCSYSPSWKALGPEERKARLPILARVAKAAEEHPFVDERPYLALAHAWANLGDFEAALKAARSYGRGPMRHPQSINMTNIPFLLGEIGALQGKAGRRDEAKATLREAIALAKAEPEFARQHGQIAANQAVRDIPGALDTLEGVEPEDRIRWLSGIAAAQALAGDVEGSRATLRRTLDALERELQAPIHGPAPGGEVAKAGGPPAAPIDPALARRDRILARIAETQAQLGDFDAAIVTSRSILDGSWKGQAMRSIGQARSAAGDTEGALNWALSLDPPLRSSALRGLAEGVANR